MQEPKEEQLFYLMLAEDEGWILTHGMKENEKTHKQKLLLLTTVTEYGCTLKQDHFGFLSRLCKRLFEEM